MSVLFSAITSSTCRSSEHMEYDRTRIDSQSVIDYSIAIFVILTALERLGISTGTLEILWWKCLATDLRVLDKMESPRSDVTRDHGKHDQSWDKELLPTDSGRRCVDTVTLTGIVASGKVQELEYVNNPTGGHLDSHIAEYPTRTVSGAITFRGWHDSTQACLLQYSHVR